MPLTPKEFKQLSSAIFMSNSNYIAGRGLTVRVEDILRLVATFAEGDPIITITDNMGKTPPGGVSFDYHYPSEETRNPKPDVETDEFDA